MPETRSQEDAASSGKSVLYKEDHENDPEFVEVDPTGRYGRYNEVLGKGAFKTVYRAFDEVDGIEVAWNQVKVQDVLQSPEDLERLYSEVHLLKTLKHKNIIKFYNSWVDAKTRNVNFITEIFTSGTLRQYRKKHKHVDMKAVKSWARQILRGLLYLHSHDPPIIHRDLKCDNIFVNGNQGEVKIGDLGLAAILRQAHAAHSVIGTPEFMAPELYEEEYNELVDIYSFGMCVLEMVTFEYPYSECTNAAQIYKKVTSGKKPAALEKVKDPEVRTFVEKCLAAASRRLPARELLMDPFLQCDGDREALELLAPRRLQTRADDMEELCSSSEERYRPDDREGNSVLASGLSEHGQVPKGSFPPHKLGSFDGGDSKTEDEIAESQEEALEFAKNSSFSSSRDERSRRSRDFRVKGKRREDDTIFLRLRIGDHEGHFRNIHFPFDIEADTALSVASEMVAELDLSDQDVTTIAEMIDAEILTLVPDWKPGAAFDESIGVEGESSPDQQLEGSYIPQADESLTESLLEPAPLTYRIYSQSPSHLPNLNIVSPTRGEPTMHGRFEEVSYQSGASDHSFQSEEFPTFSSDSCDAHDETLIGGYSCPGTPKSDGYGSNTDPSASFPLSSDLDHVNEMDIQKVDVSLNEQRTGGSIDMTSKNCVRLGNNSVRENDAPQVSAGNDECKLLQCAVNVDKTDGVDVHYEVGQISVSSETIDSDNHMEDSVAEELRALAVHQEQELRELQRKHELALFQIQRRCMHKQSSISSQSSSEGQEETSFSVQKVTHISALPVVGQPSQIVLNGTLLDDCHGKSSSSRESHLPCSSSNITNDMCAKERDLDLPHKNMSTVRETKNEILAEEEQKNSFVCRSQKGIQHPVDLKPPEECELRVDGSTTEDSKQQPTSKVSGGGLPVSCYIFTEEDSTENLGSTVNLKQVGNILSEVVDTAADLGTAEASTELSSKFWLSDVKNNLPSDSLCFLSADRVGQATIHETIQRPIEDSSVGSDVDSLDPLKVQSVVQNNHGSYVKSYEIGCSGWDKLLLPESVCSGLETPQYVESDVVAANVGEKEAVRVEQQKKEQLQKSIAELEARTLQGLYSSQTRYSVKNERKKLSDSTYGAEIALSKPHAHQQPATEPNKL